MHPIRGDKTTDDGVPVSRIVLSFEFGKTM